MSIFIKKDKKRAALEKEYASVLKKETQQMCIRDSLYRIR